MAVSRVPKMKKVKNFRLTLCNCTGTISYRQIFSAHITFRPSSWTSWTNKSCRQHADDSCYIMCNRSAIRFIHWQLLYIKNFIDLNLVKHTYKLLVMIHTYHNNIHNCDTRRWWEQLNLSPYYYNIIFWRHSINYYQLYLESSHNN